MRLGPVVLKLRLAKTSFGNMWGGAAELDLATKHPLRGEMGFVVPVMDDCRPNEYDTGINQYVTEQFGVIVAVKNDSYQQDKSGLTSYDRIHDIRNEIFGAILGWEVSWAESLIYYRGGSLLLMDPAFLWYMFKFEYGVRLLQKGRTATIPGAELVERDVIGISTITDATPAAITALVESMVGVNEEGKLDTSRLTDFDTLYINYVLGDDVRLFDGSITHLPLDDGYPDVRLPDSAQWIDLTQNLNAGAFWRAFENAFYTFKTTT
jgi:hypothetical protein